MENEELLLVYNKLKSEGRLRNSASFDDYVAKMKSNPQMVADINKYAYKSGITKDANANRWFSKSLEAQKSKQEAVNKQKEIESLAKTKVNESNQIQQEKRNQQILEEQAKVFEPTEPINQFPKTGVVAEYEKATGTPIKQVEKKETEIVDEKKSFSKHLSKDIITSGINEFNQAWSGIPESLYTLFAIPQNFVAAVTGLDIEANSTKFKDAYNIKNPILNAYIKEGENINKRIEGFNEENYESSSIYENIKKGNYTDALELTVSGVVRSAPISVSMMVGGATMSASKLATMGTVAFINKNQEQLDKENPDMSEIEKNIKAVGLSGAEFVFEALGTGSIGRVYKDIILKEGTGKGSKIFKEGLINAYKKSLKGYGAVSGTLGEMIEEGATQVTQNMINGKPYMEGVFDAMAIGGASGAAMTAPINIINTKNKINNLIKSKQASKIMDAKTKTKVNKIDDAIDKLDNDLQQEMPESIKEKLQAVKQKLVDEKGNAIESEYEKFKNLPIELKDKLGDLEDKLDVLKSEYYEIEGNPNISRESKDLLKEEIASKAQSLLDSKKEIINYKPQEVIESKEDTPSPTKEWNIEKPQAQAVEEISKTDPIISEKVEKPITEESKVVETSVENIINNGLKINGVTSIDFEDNNETILYGTKNNRTRISIKGMSKEQIQDEYDFDKGVLDKNKNRDFKAEEIEIKKSVGMTDNEKISALKELKTSKRYSDILENITLPFYENKLKETQPKPEIEQIPSITNETAPTEDIIPKEKIEEQTSLEKVQEKRRLLKAKLDAKRGVSSFAQDSKQDAQDLYDYHQVLVEEAKEYIKLGVKTLNDFAKKLGEKVSVSVKLAWDEANGDIKPILNADELNYDFDNFNDEVDEKADKKEAFERKEGEKSLFKRVYEGETDDVLKNIVETHGLNYKIENQIEVQKLAKEFVKKAGINKALEALKNNLIKGAEKAFVYAEVLDVLTNTSETASLDELLKIQEDYSSITDDAMVAFDEEARSAGRFISALYKIYQTSKIKYNLTKQINDYKANNNGEISEEVLTKFKEADKKIQELEIKIKEILEKQKKEEGDDAIESINESIEREKTKKIKQITNTDKAKLIANNIRKAKIHKPSMFASATPASIVWDGAVETVAKSIELGVSITDAIRNGVDFIKNSDWFKSLNKQDKSNALNEFQSNIINISGQQLVVVSDDGKIKVPEQLIRDLVESGINDIDILSKEVLNILKESYPDYDITIREVRDAITKYGKTVNPSKDHISIEIAKLKRTGKLISALEDVISGKRPKKSGFLRAKPTQTERELRSKVNYLLKEFPINEADLEKAWKTALEKYKTRLENQIEDIEKQISERKKTVTKKENLKLDEDAIELKRKRDELKERLNEMVGKPEVSYEKKIENTIKALEKSIESIKNQIAGKNIEYKEKPTQITNNEIERLRKIKESNLKELNKLREEAGIVEKRRLKQAKTRLENQIKLYQKKLKDKDFSKRKLKPLESDGELKNLNKEKVHWQEVFEKERYKLELENKTRKEKFKDIIIGLLNIPRILTAGAEWSMMLIQGGIQTASLATRNPKALARTFAKAIIATGSQRKMNEYTEILKSHEKYPLMKQTKLALTESDYKMELREEEHIGNNLVYGLWNLIGDGIEYGSIKVFGIKNVGSIGSTLVSIIKKDIKSNKIPISERWKNMNPLLAFERGNTIYMNELRRLRFEDGVKMLQMEGKNEIDHIEDYKKLSSAVNTMTGRANLGRLEQVNDIISVIFFSFKNTVSVFNQLNPYFYASLHSPNDPITKASTGQKLIVRDMLNFVTITTSMMFLLQAAAGSDEDDEPLIQIDTDPRSSDFMQMKLKGKEKYIRFDPWHGMRPQVVFFAKFISGLQKNKEGKIKRIGKGFKADTQWDNFMRTYIENKLSPSASIVYKYMDSEIKTIKGEEIRVRFNEPISESFDENFYPMYINALIEIEKEDPSLIIRFLSVSSMFGVNTGVYGDINKKDK